MKKALLFVLILTFAVSFSFGQQKRFQLFVFGGVNHVFEYGSEDDYVMGENDFPVTPAHTPANLGAAFAYFFTENIGIELVGRYTLSSQAILRDPSDQDTVKIDTSRHYSFSLNLLYQTLKGKLKPYFVLGGGIDKLLVKEEIYISSFGYEIEFIAPEKTIDYFANFGVGIHYFISPSLGARVDVRYILIFDDPNNVMSLSPVVGLFLRF